MPWPWEAPAPAPVKPPPQVHHRSRDVAPKMLFDVRTVGPATVVEAGNAYGAS